MSNHLHVILRNRPDWVESWSNEEVATRWRLLFPLRRDPQTGSAMEPNPNEIKALAHSPSKMVQLRQRLQSISWAMRCLNEWVARKANRDVSLFVSGQPQTIWALFGSHTWRYSCEFPVHL